MKFYTKKFLEDSIYLLEEQLQDIEKWSVYNDDKHSEEISEIKEKVEKLKSKL